MSDLAELSLDQPLGYVFDQDVIDLNVAAFAAAGVDLHSGKFNGACEAKIEAGIAYENLQDYTRDFINGEGSRLVKSQRRIAASGILEPFGQVTGICDGCSFSEGAWVAWCVNFVRNGQGPVPREVLFVAPYLLGRGNLRGDSGAYPSYSAKGYHDVGVLPVDCGGRFEFRDMQPHGIGSQEAVAVQLRDTPRLLPEWLAAMAPLRTRVFKPQSPWSLADCLASGFPVTVGSSKQITPAPVGGDGVSRLVQLRGGHETLNDGWFTLRGRLGFLKRESWWNVKFPGQAWPNMRVTIQTDNGPKQLYEGQGACWADEWWNVGQPEPWAIGFPGSVA